MARNAVGSAYDECFVDRQDALDTLESLADSVEKEQCPRYAFVYGESGIGKTEIVERFLAVRNSKRRDGQHVIRVECDEVKGPPLLSFARGMSEFQKDEGVARTMARDILRFIGCVPEIGPYLKDVVDAVRELGTSDIDRLMTGQLELFRVCSRVVESASGRRMLIFCIDDAQWLDETEVSLLNHIIQTNARSPVLFVIVAKHDGVRSQGLRHLEEIRRRAGKRAGRIDVGPLTRDSIAEMVRRISGVRVGDQQVRELHRETGGNPYLLRHAMSAGAADAGQATLPKLDESLEDAYADIHESKAVLRYAAVLGLRFELSMLSKILGMEASSAFDILSDVSKKYRLVKNPGNGEYFEFSHRITRDSVYESIKPLHAELHLKVAEFLENEDAGKQSHYLMAYHYLKTPLKDMALRHMRLAASASMSGNLFTDASEWLRQCLKVAEELCIGREEVAAIRTDYARSLLGENKVEPSRKILEELICDRYLARDRMAQVHILLSRCHRLLGTAESGAKALLHAYTAANMAEGGDPVQAGDAYAYLVTVCDHFRGDDSETRRVYQKATEYYQGHWPKLAQLYRKCGIVMESRLAIDRMRRSLHVFEEHHMDIETARCLNNIGAECLYVGRFEEAYENLFASLEKFRILGTHEVDIPLNNLGLIYLQKGDYRHAIQYFKDALDRHSEQYTKIAITTNMSIAYRKSGRSQKAVEILAEIEKAVMGNAEPVLRDYYGFNRSAVHRDLEEWEAAKEWLLKFQPNTYKNEQDLVWAKRMRALSEICKLEGTSGIGADNEAKMRKIFGTRRPQKWFYEVDYYPCDIHIFD
ncbi:MAG: AAA family ATPase [Nitrosopumilaceae archaeon]|nr:AAA family ATPase [Nitrosopumilaceae archaeon]